MSDLVTKLKEKKQESLRAKKYEKHLTAERTGCQKPHETDRLKNVTKNLYRYRLIIGFLLVGMLKVSYLRFLSFRDTDISRGWLRLLRPIIIIIIVVLTIIIIVIMKIIIIIMKILIITKNLHSKCQE